MKFTENIKEAGSWDVIVCGGGVSGIAAAVSAARVGKKTLIIEKTVNFGGLATNGLVNYFVPMCNGRGRQIIFGMADELLKLSWRESWSSTNETWRQDYPQKNGRLDGRFSPAIFSLVLVDFLKKAGVEVYIDTLLGGADIKDGHIDGIIIDSKSGREYLKAKMYVDATGDADLLYRAGVPTVEGKNYFTYYAFGITMQSMQRAVERGKIGEAQSSYFGGYANLYGQHQPEGRRFYSGVTKEDVTEYVLDNQMQLYENIKDKDRNEFDLTLLPSMPQLRTTRRLDGDKTFSEEDAYKHCDDSICAINDFDRKDFLYEVPYGVLVKTGFDNVITAGRSASAQGYGWDVLRVIPPAILTGQAAGVACALAIDTDAPIYGVDIKALQKILEKQNVMIHFDDAWVPKDRTKIEKENNGHI